MQKDERDLLEALRFELEFLEKGGYGRSPREPWRPQFIFEDSPTCMNYDCKENPGPCSNCVLMQLVPPERRSEKIPCRHIPFGASGETLDSLYRYGEQHEIEETAGNWLRETIKRLEDERKALQRNDTKPPRPDGEAMKGTPLYQSLHPKCANPACPTRFEHRRGGKFFRFRRDPSSQGEAEGLAGARSASHNVEHFWLCARCCQVFTLVYVKGQGVVLRLSREELPAEASREMLTAA